MKHASKLEVEQRLDQVEGLWLEGMSRIQLLDYFQGPGPLENCKQSSCKKNPSGCTHGPPRWSSENGKPISERTIDTYLAKVRLRLLKRSQEQRARNRAFVLGQIDRALGQCWQTKNMKELGSLLRFRTELDGSRLASEEMQEPTLYERVRALMVTCEDYEPTVLKKSLPPKLASESRFYLEKLEYLLLQADQSVAAYRQIKRPTNEVETRLYWRTQLTEAAHQAVTNPGLTPEIRREALHKLAAAYAMIAKDTDLAEQLEQIKQEIVRMKNQRT